MIHKVYIVRCSYCHAPLLEPYGLGQRPRYFYDLAAIPQAIKEAQWTLMSGTEVCYSCVEKNKSSEL